MSAHKRDRFQNESDSPGLHVHTRELQGRSTRQHDHLIRELFVQESVLSRIRKIRGHTREHIQLAETNKKEL